MRTVALQYGINASSDIGYAKIAYSEIGSESTEGKYLFASSRFLNVVERLSVKFIGKLEDPQIQAVKSSKSARPQAAQASTPFFGWSHRSRWTQRVEIDWRMFMQVRLYSCTVEQRHCQWKQVVWFFIYIRFGSHATSLLQKRTGSDWFICKLSILQTWSLVWKLFARLLKLQNTYLHLLLLDYEKTNYANFLSAPMKNFIHSVETASKKKSIF